jgi:hypothetical protein
MTKSARYLLYFLVVDAVAIGGYFAYKAVAGGKSGAADFPWTTVDAAYVPKNQVEEFIKNDADVRGALPVSIRNYGRDAKVLKKFKGRQFAQPTENVLALFFKGLDDWMLVDIKYKTETEREAQRTVLYIFADKQWKVGDTGTLLK